MKTFLWCDLQKGLHVFFCKLYKHFFKSNNAGRHLYPDFANIFSKLKLLEVPFHPLHPTAFHSSIIGNFMVYQD